MPPTRPLAAVANAPGLGHRQLQEMLIKRSVCHRSTMSKGCDTHVIRPVLPVVTDAIRSDTTAQTLAGEIVGGDRRGLARAITLVESTRADHRVDAAALLDELLPHTGHAIRIGISGAPGVGKSTFIEQLRFAHRRTLDTASPSSRSTLPARDPAARSSATRPAWTSWLATRRPSSVHHLPGAHSAASPAAPARRCSSAKRPGSMSWSSRPSASGRARSRSTTWSTSSSCS